MIELVRDQEAVNFILLAIGFVLVIVLLKLSWMQDNIEDKLDKLIKRKK